MVKARTVKLQKKEQHALHLATRGANIFVTHRSLYLQLMLVAVASVALGLNYFLTTPTFKPYDIPSSTIGIVFLITGVGYIVFLNLFRNLKIVRIVMAISAGYYMFWGITNSQQFFLGKASLAFPVIFILVAGLQFVLMLEPSINPMTMNIKPKKKKGVPND